MSVSSRASSQDASGPEERDEDARRALQAQLDAMLGGHFAVASPSIEVAQHIEDAETETTDAAAFRLFSTDAVRTVALEPAVVEYKRVERE